MIYLFEKFNKYQKLIDDVKRTAAENGVRTILPKEETVPYYGGPVAGYFSDNGEPILACGIKGNIKNWGAILAHESSHMDQWIEKSPYWTGNYINGKESVDWLSDWCEGHEFSDKEVENFIVRAMEVELDCEKRTIKKFIKYELPVNIEEETQKAISYIWYYRFLTIFRKWYDKGTPYLIPEVWTQMPKTFDFDMMKTPKKIENLYREYCLEEE